MDELKLDKTERQVLGILLIATDRYFTSEACKEGMSFEDCLTVAMKSKRG